MTRESSNFFGDLETDAKQPLGLLLRAAYVGLSVVELAETRLLAEFFREPLKVLRSA